MSCDRCPICGSRPAHPCLFRGPDRMHGTPGSFYVAVCAECGGGWTQPPATAEELPAFYPGSYQAYVLQRGLLGAIQRRGQRLILDCALRHPPLDAVSQGQGTLLDVGCGRGDLGAALIRHGWTVAGVDPSPQACELARARGIDARLGTLDSIEFEPGSFDAVVMTHSLEHVLDPVADLGRVNGLLRPGGLLVISLPNFGSWQRRWFGSSWYPLELPRHRTHFTRHSLELALRTAGFDVFSVRPGSDNGFALLASLQYALAGRLMLTRPPQAWLGYAFSPINRLIDLICGNGALLNAVARRPSR